MQLKEYAGFQMWNHEGISDTKCRRRSHKSPFKVSLSYSTLKRFIVKFRKPLCEIEPLEPRYPFCLGCSSSGNQFLCLQRLVELLLLPVFHTGNILWPSSGAGFIGEVKDLSDFPNNRDNTSICNLKKNTVWHETWQPYYYHLSKQSSMW